MNEEKKYWRDAAIKLLAWGTGSLIVVSGFAIKESKLFELGPFARQSNVDANVMRAVALLILVFAFSNLWYFGLRWIYRNHLSNDVDSTVISWRYVNIYLLAVLSILWILTILVALL